MSLGVGNAERSADIPIFHEIGGIQAVAAEELGALEI